MSEKLSHLGYITEHLQSLMQFGGGADHALAHIALNMNRVQLPVRDDSDDEEFLIHAGAWALLLEQQYLANQCFNLLAGVRLQPKQITSFHVEARKVIDIHTKRSRDLYEAMELPPHYSNSPEVRGVTAEITSKPATTPHAAA